MDWGAAHNSLATAFGITTLAESVKITGHADRLAGMHRTQFRVWDAVQRMLASVLRAGLSDFQIRTEPVHD
jgi:fibrillarin-like rRNA methylase